MSRPQESRSPWARLFSNPTAGRVGGHLFVLILLGLAVYLVLPHVAELEHAVQVMQNLELWAVALAVAAQVLFYVCSGYTLHALLAVTRERLSIPLGMLIHVAAYSVGLVAGGTVGYAAMVYRWTRAKGISRHGALLTGWLPSVFVSAVLVVVGGVGMAQLFFVHELSGLQTVSFALALVIVGALAAMVSWSVRHRSRLVGLLTRITLRWSTTFRRSFDAVAIEQAAGRYFEAWDELRSGGWRGPALGASLTVACDMVTLYLLFDAAGNRVSLAVLLTGYGLPMLLGRIPFLPGGVGVVESTMVALYHGFDVPEATAVVVVLAYRTISFWMPALLGFPVAVYLQRHTSNAE